MRSRLAVGAAVVVLACVGAVACSSSTSHPSLYAYSHTRGACSVTGGYVYRGRRIPLLQGKYVFTDFCSGQLSAFTPNGTRRVDATPLGVHADQPTSFGEDQAGEIDVLSRAGTMYRLEAA